MRRYVILTCSLIACAAGLWAVFLEGLSSPGGAALVVGAVGLGFWSAGWFQRDKERGCEVE